MSTNSIMTQLMATIEDRKRNPPARSYTTTLFRGGVAAIGAKIVEESQEVVEAASLPDDPARAPQIIHEAADLVYHLLVLLAHREITWEQVEAELARRFAVSGLDEKASRPRATDHDNP